MRADELDHLKSIGKEKQMEATRDREIFILIDSDQDRLIGYCGSCGGSLGRPPYSDVPQPVVLLDDGNYVHLACAPDGGRVEVLPG